ncbi:MAG TPA: hypothetical protein VJ904_04435, partial [Tichowtungia sp.]|nr:hypothetical protein [Tichowtungia sp.]
MNLRRKIFSGLTVGLMATGLACFGSDWPDGRPASRLVDKSPTGLVYTAYANIGETNEVNTLIDYSSVGYKGGGVPIPFVPAAVT